MKEYKGKRYLLKNIFSRSWKILYDGNFYIICIIYKIVKLFWFSIVDNVEFVGLINDIYVFVFDVFYLCIGVFFL